MSEQQGDDMNNTIQPNSVIILILRFLISLFDIMYFETVCEVKVVLLFR